MRHGHGRVRTCVGMRAKIDRGMTKTERQNGHFRFMLAVFWHFSTNWKNKEFHAVFGGVGSIMESLSYIFK